MNKPATPPRTVSYVFPWDTKAPRTAYPITLPRDYRPFAAALRLMYREHALTWSQPCGTWPDGHPASTEAAIHRAYFHRLDNGMIPGLIRRNGKVSRT